ncbi:putative nuclease HARBI1 [Merluccius polli]|uniref:Nuclease HARBI1 n=1 Tax=Merluccius polli TaxID=89951 RepID=A0AA47N9H9_MERPO|nr:putative nuclease HARBI1 [Merluccius polli]
MEGEGGVGMFALLLSPSRNPVLKTGTEWEILLEMDEHTFRRHLRVTWAQFDFLLMKFEQQGAIDGCHIKIQRPTLRGGDYLNRKGFYSVLLQGIVNERGRFLDIFVGPPGRVHDARMLRTSDFYRTWEEKMENNELLGDSAYCGNTHLL